MRFERNVGSRVTWNSCHLHIPMMSTEQSSSGTLIYKLTGNSLPVLQFITELWKLHETSSSWMGPALRICRSRSYRPKGHKVQGEGKQRWMGVLKRFSTQSDDQLFPTLGYFRLRNWAQSYNAGVVSPLHSAGRVRIHPFALAGDFSQTTILLILSVMCSSS